MQSIRNKLIFLLVGFSMISTLLVGGFFIYDLIKTNDEQNAEYKKLSEAAFDREMKLQVQQAYSMVEAVYQKQLDGVLTEAQAKEEAKDLLRKLRYDGGGYFFVDTSKGVNVVHGTLGKKIEDIPRFDAKDSQGIFYIQEIIKGGMQEGGGYSNFSFPKPNETQDLPKRAFAMHFKPYDWIITTGSWIDFIEAKAIEHKAAADESLKKEIYIAIGILLLIQLLIAGAGFYAAKHFSEPLKNATNRLKRFAGGDFSVDVRESELKRPDEFGQMAVAFQELNKRMRALLRSIADSAEGVAASSEELTASASQSAQVSDQVAQSITDVASGAGNQLTAINSTTHIIEQLSSSIEEVSANAITSANKAVEAADTAKQGRRDVENAVRQMSLIENAVNDSAKMVAKLGERSQEIGQIVDTISSIAGQTNLLALNAAIEAARAGEQGRGFAVVAEEVRKLAEQSQEAAKKISDLISVIQSDTREAVVTMETGTKEVKAGAAVVVDSGKSFGMIAGLVETVSGQSQNIAEKIQEMAKNSQQIVENVKSVDQMSKNVASEAETVSAATEEQSASIQEISHASQSLADMAQKLQTAIQSFKLK